MNDKDFDRLLGEALHIAIPKGLGEKLEKQIDRCVEVNKKTSRRPLSYWLISAAAVALLAIGIFLPANRRAHIPADTFTDPAEATVAAEQAITFMSAQLNKGLNRVSIARQEFEKANKTIGKHFNK